MRERPLFSWDGLKHAFQRNESCQLRHIITKEWAFFLSSFMLLPPWRYFIYFSFRWAKPPPLNAKDACAIGWWPEKRSLLKFYLWSLARAIERARAPRYVRSRHRRHAKMPATTIRDVTIMKKSTPPAMLYMVQTIQQHTEQRESMRDMPAHNASFFTIWYFSRAIRGFSDNDMLVYIWVVLTIMNTPQPDDRVKMFFLFIMMNTELFTITGHCWCQMIRDENIARQRVATHAA